MSFCRLGVIYTASCGDFSKKLHVLVEERDTWHLIACINDMPVGQQEVSFFLPSFAIKWEAHPKQQTRINLQIGISMRENHNGGRNMNKQTLSVGFVADCVGHTHTQVKNTSKYSTYTRTVSHAHTHKQENTITCTVCNVCSVIDSLKLKLMFMNVLGLCISIVLFVELVNWPSFRYSLRTANCIIIQRGLNIFR